MRNQLPLRGLLSLTLVAGLQIASSASAAEVKNVIVLIPDGQSTSIQTLGRWFRGEPLALDQMGAGTMATWMVNSITTDSAPAATAMATGYKSTDKFIRTVSRAPPTTSSGTGSLTARSRPCSRGPRAEARRRA